jgi:hypothetical protein
MTKLAQTSETQVAVIMLVMNLEKIRKNLFCVFILAMIVGRKTPKSHFPGDWGIVKWQHRVFSGGPIYRPGGFPASSSNRNYPEAW